jgi:hypothetical protein
VLCIVVLTLFSNESDWMNRVHGFDESLIRPPKVWSRSNLEEIGVTMADYTVNVDNMDKWVPQPRLSGE